MSLQLQAVSIESNSFKQQMAIRDQEIKMELDRISQEAVPASSAAAQAQSNVHTGA